MKKRIVEYCKQIEQENNIKIIFAVEAGSRLWRMSSDDSDYDVRFVFVQPLEKYISLKNSKETDKVLNFIFDDKMIDFSGFDIFKFCKLLDQSNPSVIEWLRSDIVYYGKIPLELKKIASKHFNPTSLIYHYKSMSRQNYEKYVKSGKNVTYKKYLYALRGLINSKYIENTGKLPSIHFPVAVKKSKRIVPNNIINKIEDVIQRKKYGKEKDKINNIKLFDTYIDSFLADKKHINCEFHKGSEKINKELKKIVLRKWP